MPRPQYEAAGASWQSLAVPRSPRRSSPACRHFSDSACHPIFGAPGVCILQGAWASGYRSPQCPAAWSPPCPLSLYPTLRFFRGSHSRARKVCCPPLSTHSRRLFPGLRDLNASLPANAKITLIFRSFIILECSPSHPPFPPAISSLSFPIFHPFSHFPPSLPLASLLYFDIQKSNKQI